MFVASHLPHAFQYQFAPRQWATYRTGESILQLYIAFVKMSRRHTYSYSREVFEVWMTCRWAKWEWACRMLRHPDPARIVAAALRVIALRSMQEPPEICAEFSSLTTREVA